MSLGPMSCLDQVKNLIDNSRPHMSSGLGHSVILFCCRCEGPQELGQQIIAVDVTLHTRPEEFLLAICGFDQQGSGDEFNLPAVLRCRQMPGRPGVRT